MYNEKKNIEKAIKTILSSPELTLDELREAIAYEKKNCCYLVMSPKAQYEVYRRAAVELFERELTTDSLESQQITIPLHEYLCLKALQAGSDSGMDFETIENDLSVMSH